MIKKIIVENFMAHKRTELELGPGVTALTGPNNTGKSALVEALRCVVENPTPRHYIRHGEKKARVTVVLEDGHEVTWVRKKQSPGYEILKPGAEEPEEFWKLGRGGVPEEVRNLLRMDQVDLGDGAPIDVHIGDQRNPIFLLNRPDRAVADFLAASSEGAYLLDMQGALKRKVQEAKKEYAGRQARLRDIESELDTLAPLPDLKLSMQETQALDARLQTLGREIPALEELLRTRAFIERQLAQAVAELDVLEALDPVPAVEDLHDLRVVMAEQKDLRHRVAFAHAYEDVLTPLAAVPEPQPTAPLDALQHELRMVADSLRKSERDAAVLADLQVPGEVEPVADAAALHDEILQYSKSLSYLRTFAEQLDKMKSAPEPLETDPLSQMVAEMRSMQEAIHAAQAEQQEAGARLAAFEQAMRTRLTEIGRCPTCGGELEADEFMSGEGAHEH